MDILSTYKQDTTQVNLLQEHVQSAKELEIGRKPVSVLRIEKREAKTGQIPAKKTYTHQQIRNWRWKQENKLLVDSSRYIKSREGVELSYTAEQDYNIVLPIREKISAGTDWLTIVLFLGILLFATIRYSYVKYISHLYLSLFNYATSLRLLKEKNYPLFHAAYRLDVIFYLTFSLLVFQSLNIIKWENPVTNWSYFAIVLVAVLAYFYLKKLIYLFLGLIFEAVPETREYLFNMDNFNRSLGIILLPVVAVISFSPAQNPDFIVFAGLTIAITFNILLLQRGISLLLKKQFSLLYLFLYLCTLEFLPLLLIYKVVVE